jgi:hypothetical protein
MNPLAVYLALTTAEDRRRRGAERARIARMAARGRREAAPARSPRRASPA